MAEDEYKKIFAKNLKHYMTSQGKNQMDPLWAYVATNAAGNLHYVVSKNRSIIDIFDGDEVKVIK